jgi:hypothetical protein
LISAFAHYSQIVTDGFLTVESFKRKGSIAYSPIISYKKITEKNSDHICNQLCKFFQESFDNKGENVLDLAMFKS